MAKSKKIYVAKVGIRIGTRIVKRGNTVSPSNVKKETFKNLLDKGYIIESKLDVPAEPKKVNVKVKEVTGDDGKDKEPVNENVDDDNEDDDNEDDEDGLNIDPDEVVE